MVTPLIAAKAYAATQGAGVGALGGAEAAPGGPDFAKMLGAALNDAVSAAGRLGERRVLRNSCGLRWHAAVPLDRH